jgi:hypothetical protein
MDTSVRFSDTRKKLFNGLNWADDYSNVSGSKYLLAIPLSLICELT